MVHNGPPPSSYFRPPNFRLPTVHFHFFESLKNFGQGFGHEIVSECTSVNLCFKVLPPFFKVVDSWFSKIFSLERTKTVMPDQYLVDHLVLIGRLRRCFQHKKIGFQKIITSLNLNENESNFMQCQTKLLLFLSFKMHENVHIGDLSLLESLSKHKYEPSLK